MEQTATKKNKRQARVSKIVRQCDYLLRKCERIKRMLTQVATAMVLVCLAFISQAQAVDPFKNVVSQFGVLPDGITTQEWVNEVERSCNELGALHYVASVHSNAKERAKSADLQARLDSCEAELNPPIPPINQRCIPLQKGELWKPVSESHGTPALLMAGSMFGEDAFLYDETETPLVNSDGFSIGTIRTSCCNNGGKAHWFFEDKCSEYPSPTYVEFTNGACRIIPTPCKRIQP